MMIPNMMLYYIPQSEESDLSLYNIKNSGGSFQENNPCNQGLSYECFSEATAAQCGHVRNIIFVLFYELIIRIFL